MHTTIKLAGITAIMLTAASARAATPLGDAFTYQGRLTDNGTPANGLYDFSFTLYDVLTGTGTLLVDPVQLEDVPVENGVFTVQLDFGSGYFTGSQRWVEIGVRAGASTGAFETLAGRQELTAAPYAQYARQIDPRIVIPTIIGFNGSANSTAPGGAAAPWSFAGPTTTVSLVTGQRVTAAAVGGFSPSTPGAPQVYTAICRQPAAGGTLVTLNGGPGVQYAFQDGVLTRQQLSAAQSANVSTSGSFRIGLCIRNVSAAIAVGGDSVDGWVMVSN